MNPSRSQLVGLLARRVLAERRRLIAGVSLGSFLLALLTTLLYSSLGAEYDALIDEMPEALVSMLGDADLSTLEGWLQAEVFSFMGPGMVIGTAIAVASGALGGAEQQGRLTLLTTAPLHRSTLIAAVAAAMVLSASATAATLFIGIMVGAVIAAVPVAVGKVLATCVLLLLLAVTLGSCALAVGASTARRGSAIAGGVGAAVASYAIFSFFPLSTRLEPFAKFSLWHPFASNSPLQNGIRLADAALLMLLSAMLFGIAVVRFERRDLAG